MTRVQKICLVVLLVLLAATAFAWWRTLESSLIARAPSATASPARIDQSSFATAKNLASRAATAEEQGFALSAMRLADHELDLAFTAALLDAEAHPPVLSALAQGIQIHLQKAKQQLDAEQANIARLNAALASKTATNLEQLQDELALAQSQLELDKDDIDAANQNLLDAGGNLQQRIQSMVGEHEAAEHAGAAKPAVATVGNTDAGGLVGTLRAWVSLREQSRQLADAQEAATANADALAPARAALALRVQSSKGNVTQLAQRKRTHDDAAAVVAKTRQISGDNKILTLMDRRIADHRELAGVYRQWSLGVAIRASTLLHSVLIDVAIVLGLLVVLLFLDDWLQGLLDRTKFDRRQVETLRGVTRVSLQVLAVFVILLIVIGVPSQLGTMLGLAGAGLTVALKDFIIAFFGWFVLMGKNGMRIGDWVEINGVSGEVIELGLFHTVLLETGNWTDAGHPTGRRVTFTNSFAIERHYFNFSTSGQWLWDELQVVVPPGQDPYPIVDAIHKKVLEATADSALQAEQEWLQAAPGRRGSKFSGQPGLNVKPVVGGVEITVRYITRANERFAVRAKLYQAAVDLLGKSAAGVP